MKFNTKTKQNVFFVHGYPKQLVLELQVKVASSIIQTTLDWLCQQMKVEND